MVTTALIVELLVVGVLATIWIGLLVLAWISDLDLPHSFAILSAFLLPYLSVAYCLGIVINRSCDFLFRPLEKEMKIYKENWVGGEVEYAHARLVVFHGSPGLTAYLDKIWALIRIFRSTMLNSVFLTLAGLVFIWVRLDWTTTKSVLWTLVFMLLEGALLILLWKSWEKKTEHYHKNLKHAYEIVLSEKGSRELLK